MRVADTSFLYAYFNAGDAHHAQSVECMRQDAPTLIEHGILQETLDLITYRKGKPAAIAAKDHLDGLPTITYTAVEERPPIDGVWRNHDRLSLADATAAWLARIEGAELLSFDQGQLDALVSLHSA